MNAATLSAQEATLGVFHAKPDLRVVQSSWSLAAEITALAVRHCNCRHCRMRLITCGRGTGMFHTCRVVRGTTVRTVAKAQYVPTRSREGHADHGYLSWKSEALVYCAARM